MPRPSRAGRARRATGVGPGIHVGSQSRWNAAREEWPCLCVLHHSSTVRVSSTFRTLVYYLYSSSIHLPVRESGHLALTACWLRHLDGHRRSVSRCLPPHRGEVVSLLNVRCVRPSTLSFPVSFLSPGGAGVDKGLTPLARLLPATKRCILPTPHSLLRMRGSSRDVASPAV